MNCPHCHNEISDSSTFCPNCGQRISSGDRLPEDETLHCKSCNHEISQLTERCPECHRKLTFSERHTKAEKLGYRDLMIAAFGTSFGLIFPLLGIVLNVTAIVIGYLDKEKDSKSYEAFIIGIIGLSMVVFLEVFQIFQMMQNLYK